MKRVFKIVLSAIKYFFNFRKPVVNELHCIDLVVGNKLLFLLAWDIRYAGLIKINPGRRKFHQASGAAVISLLPATEAVDIVIRNCWRRCTLTIPLKHITLDSESLRSLTADLRLFTTITIQDIHPNQLPVLPNSLLTMPQINNFFFQSNIKPQFNYQKFTYYEP